MSKIFLNPKDIPSPNNQNDIIVFINSLDGTHSYITADTVPSSIARTGETGPVNNLNIQSYTVSPTGTKSTSSAGHIKAVDQSYLNAAPGRNADTGQGVPVPDKYKPNKGRPPYTSVDFLVNNPLSGLNTSGGQNKRNAPVTVHKMEDVGGGNFRVKPDHAIGRVINYTGEQLDIIPSGDAFIFSFSPMPPAMVNTGGGGGGRGPKGDKGDANKLYVDITNDGITLTANPSLGSGNYTYLWTCKSVVQNIFINQSVVLDCGISGPDNQQSVQMLADSNQRIGIFQCQVTDTTTGVVVNAYFFSYILAVELIP